MRSMLMGLLSLAIVAMTTAEGAEVRELIAKLKEKDNDTRRAAARELAELGPEARSAVTELTKALRDPDLFVRRYSAEALGKIGPEAKASVTALAGAMNDPKKEVQLAAVEALGKIGPASTNALISAVKDPNKDPGVRRIAAQSLGKIGPQARGAVGALSDIVSGKAKMGKANKGKGNDDDIRADAARALGSVAKAEDKAAVEALKAVSEGKQRNRELKAAAGESLRKITGTAPAKKNKKD